jgi:hypothetical protein
MKLFICLAILEAAMAAASGRRAVASEQEIRNIDTRAAAHGIEARDPVSDVRIFLVFSL